MSDQEFIHGLSDFGVSGSVGKTLVLGGRWESSHRNARDLDDLESIVVREAGIGMPWGDLNFKELCKAFPKLRYVDVEYQSIDDLTWLSALNQLDHIGVRCKSIKDKNDPFETPVRSESVDVTGQVQLLKLITHSTKRVRIENLREQNIEFLAGANFEKLEIVKAPALSNLDGIDRNFNLREVSIYSAPKLFSVQGLFELSGIQRISLQSCKNLSTPVLLNESNVRFLSFLDCGSLETLDWIKMLVHLDYLRVSGTNVLDGKVGFLKEIPNIQKLVIENKRHYDAIFELPSAPSPRAL